MTKYIIKDAKLNSVKDIAQEAFDLHMKFNYNCPDAEKSGFGPGSCGGGKDSKDTSKASAPLSTEEATEPHPDLFRMSKKVGSLNKVNPVEATDASKEFATHYINGKKGDYINVNPTEKNQKDAEKFYTRYENVGGVSGFAGSGSEIYRDKETDRHFHVQKEPNGNTFYGTTHYIRETNKPRK